MTQILRASGLQTNDAENKTATEETSPDDYAGNRCDR